MILPWILFLFHISNPILTHGRGSSGGSEGNPAAITAEATAADPTDFRWVFHMGLCWFLFGLILVWVSDDFCLAWLWWFINCWNGCGSDGWVVLSWWMEVCLLLCWVAVSVGKERNLNGEWEKNNKLLIRSTVILVSVQIYTFLNGSFGGKLCKFWLFFFFFDKLLQSLRLL